MIVDYHTHTSLCNHAQGDIEEYILAAIKLGIDEIGCSDHAPLPGNYDERHRMSAEEYYSTYAPSVSRMHEKYRKQIRIRRAIEIDYLDWADEWNRQFIRENDFDYVIGSVHFVGPLGKERALFGRDYDEREIESLYEGYYQAVAASARSGLFDVIGHCDIVKKVGSFTSKRVDELIWEALRQIKQAGLCIELNTSGLRKPEKETYPSRSILQRVRELNIPITIGSDAHTPGDVGRDLDQAIQLAKSFAAGRISIFDHRQRTEVRV
jgi:histidinol-phosphatase (PHP family)